MKEVNTWVTSSKVHADANKLYGGEASDKPHKGGPRVDYFVYVYCLFVYVPAAANG